MNQKGHDIQYPNDTIIQKETKRVVQGSFVKNLVLKISL